MGGKKKGGGKKGGKKGGDDDGEIDQYRPTEDASECHNPESKAEPLFRLRVGLI